MVSRLLWKEFREDWLAAAIAFIAPWALFNAAKIVPDSQKEVIRAIAWICVPIAVILWAASKGGGGNDEGKRPLAYLPANSIIELVVSLVVPMAISAFAGAWLGLVCDVPGSRRADIVSFGMLYMTIGFAGGYLISAAISAWAGIAAGIVWVMVGCSFVDELFMGRLFSNPKMLPFMLRLDIGFAVCLALFLLLVHKKRFLIARVSSLFLLALILFGPPIYNYYKSSSGRVALNHNVESIHSADWSLLIYDPTGDTHYSGRRTLRFVNYITRQSSATVFDGEAHPIAFDKHGYGYVAQQIPKSGFVRIIAWGSNQKKDVARVPAPENAMDDWLHYYESIKAGSASPDGRYLMVTLRSYGGGGVDIWIVNLRTGDTWIAFPNVIAMSRNVSWFDNTLALSGRDNIWTVDLLTGKTGTLRPAAVGVKK